MKRIIGVKSVICTCGKVMVRTGGVFGVEITYSTYLCKDCRKAINAVDLPEKEVADMLESQTW